MYCLPLEGKRRPTKHVDFGAQSLSALFPNCLHLRNIVTFVSPKLATSDAATSYWMRFPLINLYTLLGVLLIVKFSACKLAFFHQIKRRYSIN